MSDQQMNQLDELDQDFEEAMDGMDIGRVQEMLSDGYEVNQSRNDVNTPLMWSRNKRFAKLLLSYGADIEYPNAYGQTPLMKAVEDQNLDLVVFYLKQEAQVNVVDTFHRTPLLCAIEHDDKATAMLLIEHGADITFKDDHGNSIVHYAADSGMLDVLKYLDEQGIDLNQVNRDGETPLMMAASNHFQEVVAWLLEHGADVRHIDRHGMTALCWASNESTDDDEPTLSQLLSAGADVNHQAQDGHVPLQRVCLTGDGAQCVKRLLAHGAKLDTSLSLKPEDVMNKQALEWIKMKLLYPTVIPFRPRSTSKNRL